MWQLLSRILHRSGRLIVGRPEHYLHEGLEPRPLFWNPILTHLAMFTAKGAFRDYKTEDDLLNRRRKKCSSSNGTHACLTILSISEKAAELIQPAYSVSGSEIWVFARDTPDHLQFMTFGRKVSISSVRYLICRILRDATEIDTRRQTLFIDAEDATWRAYQRRYVR